MKTIPKGIFLGFLVTLMLGCQSQEHATSLSTQEHPIKKSKPLSSKEQNLSKERDLLGEMGFYLEQEKIIIDLNQTNLFFRGLEKEAKAKAQALEDALAEINITRDAGILVEKSKLSLDLNQTKQLLNNISHIFENTLFDQNRSEEKKGLQ